MALVACAGMPGRDLFSSAQGTWGSPGSAELACDRNPHTIAFSPDRRAMWLRYRRPVRMDDGSESDSARYRVLGHTRNAILLALEGETRQTPSGDPVLWDLVVLSSERTCWHRTDWPAGTCTADAERCVPPSTEPSGDGRPGPPAGPPWYLRDGAQPSAMPSDGGRRDA
jgi:hypothetical protein